MFRTRNKKPAEIGRVNEPLTPTENDRVKLKHLCTRRGRNEARPPPKRGSLFVDLMFKNLSDQAGIFCTKILI